MLHGELAIGGVAAPHTRKATITFTDNVERLNASFSHPWPKRFGLEGS